MYRAAAPFHDPLSLQIEGLLTHARGHELIESYERSPSGGVAREVTQGCRARVFTSEVKDLLRAHKCLPPVPGEKRDTVSFTRTPAR